MSTSNDTPNKKVILITEENLSEKLDMLKRLAKLSKISNDEEESPEEEPFEEVSDFNNKQNIFVEEDISKTEQPQNACTGIKTEDTITANCGSDSEIGEKTVEQIDDLFSKKEQKESTPPTVTNNNSSQILNSGKQDKKEIEKTAKNNEVISRDDLAASCKQKIKKKLGNRLNDYQNKLKSIDQRRRKDRKKPMLHIDFKSKKQKVVMPGTRTTPVKVNRSLSKQNFLKKACKRQKNLAQLQNPNNNKVAKKQVARNVRTLTQSPQQQEPPQEVNNPPIPVARPQVWLLAHYPVFKIPSSIPITVNRIISSKTPSSIIDTKNLSTSQKVTEKRRHDKIISATIDLTDDEPPVKMNNQTSPASPVPLLPLHNVMATPQQHFLSTLSNPNKICIPITIPQSQNMGSRSTVMLKTVDLSLMQQRYTAIQIPQYTDRMSSLQTGTDPAPLVGAMNLNQLLIKDELPPPLVLKLSNAGNKLVISWEIDGDPKISYEPIASYQLYVYQETLSPQCTVLWKKIIILKAWPFTLLCGLKHFTAGYKYHFAMRAVDNRSSYGPMSIPVSIVMNRNL